MCGQEIDCPTLRDLSLSISKSPTLKAICKAVARDHVGMIGTETGHEVAHAILRNCCDKADLITIVARILISDPHEACRLQAIQLATKTYEQLQQPQEESIAARVWKPPHMLQTHHKRELCIIVCVQVKSIILNSLIKDPSAKIRKYCITVAVIMKIGYQTFHCSNSIECQCLMLNLFFSTALVISCKEPVIAIAQSEL
jgi:hypothetical protein